jgi:hypothetical protein
LRLQAGWGGGAADNEAGAPLGVTPPHPASHFAALMRADPPPPGEGAASPHTPPRSRDSIRPSFANSFTLKKRKRAQRDPQERAQGRPGARCTRGLACKGSKQKRTRAYRFSGSSPAFPARWCYSLFRALPGETRACLSPSPPRSVSFLKNLTHLPLGRQDHTTLPSASRAVRQKRIRVHRVPPCVS